MPTRPAAVLSVAAELPEGRLTSAALAELAGHQRGLDRVAHRDSRTPPRGPHERLSDYAARAGQAASSRAGVNAEDLDLVIVATITADEVTPSAAPLVAEALGATHGGCVRRRRRVHRVPLRHGARRRADRERPGRAGSAHRCRLPHPHHRLQRQAIAPLFADGAGAVVLCAAGEDDGAIGPIVLGADGSHGPTLIAPHSDRAAADGRHRGLPPRRRADVGGNRPGG